MSEAEQGAAGEAGGPAPLSPFPWRPPRRWLEAGLLVGILAGLLALKIRYAATEVALGIDGSYYYDIAAHVRDGDGLVTDVSLFNAGYAYFPHPTAVYPLWPLVLGYAARIVPLEQAAIWLPTIFYFGAIALAYRLARRVAPDPLFPETWPVVHAGHVAAAVLGLTNVMFQHTTKPYTEGLAYFLLLLALCRAERFFRAPAAWRGLELGGWLGLVVLTRSQLVLGVMAVAGALVWALLRLGWRRWLGPTAAFIAGLAAVLGAQLVHLSGFVEAPRWVHLLRFDLAHDPVALPPLAVMVQTEGALAWLADRGRGVLVAFGNGDMSYFHSFGLWSAALPLALPFLILDGIEAARRRRLGLWRWLHGPENLFKLAFALLAIGGLVSLHTIHKAMFTPWNFGMRHALTAGFAIFAAIVYLARRPALGRVLAIFLVAASSYTAFWRLNSGLAAKRPRPAIEESVAWTAAHNHAIVAWLTARAAAEPGLVVVVPDREAQKLARYTDGVGYHWIYRTTTWEELEFLFNERGARLLLLRADKAKRMKIGGDLGRFGEMFTREAEGLSGFVVFRRRLPGEPPAQWPEEPPTAAAMMQGGEPASEGE